MVRNNGCGWVVVVVVVVRGEKGLLLEREKEERGGHCSRNYM